MSVFGRSTSDSSSLMLNRAVEDSIQQDRLMRWVGDGDGWRMDKNQWTVTGWRRVLDVIRADRTCIDSVRREEV